MIVKDLPAKQQRVLQLLAAEHPLPEGDLAHVAAQILQQREALLACVARHGTPGYVFDRRGFQGALQGFRRVFDSHIPGHAPYYAVKSNHHPLVVAEAVQQGYGLDVSSGRELRQALAHAGCPILFSGPAKSDDDLTLACDHADRVLVHMDSFRELARLGQVSARLQRRVRVGVRVSLGHGAWSKFGIPLADLAGFWRAAAAYPFIDLCAIQSHLSWNRDARPYVTMIEELGRALAQGFSAAERAAIAVIDVGGGYRPHRLEGYFPFDHPLGAVIKAADEHAGEDTEFLAPYYVKDSIPLESYAQAIGAAIDQHLRPQLPRAVYFSEPGRIVSTHAMHIVLRVVDVKRPDLVIVDGGINMVGWERYQQIYYPVVNLTHPGATEIPVRLGGSLCDCEDLWGLRCYAERLEEGDVLIVPYQGAYTFCVAQEFIRPIPPVFEL